MSIISSLTWMVAGPARVVDGRPWLNPHLDTLLDSLLRQTPRPTPPMAVNQVMTYLRPLRERPEEHIQAITAVSDALTPALDELRARRWTLENQADADDFADLLAVLGRVLISRAWLIRGSGTAATVRTDAWAVFGSLLAEADDILGLALKVRPGHPAAATFRLITSRGLQLDQAENRERFEIARTSRSTLFHAHDLMLNCLCAKWGGSDDLMFDFGRTVAAQAPPGDPVVAMLPFAHAEYVCSILMKRSRRGGPSAQEARAADLDAVMAASLKWCGDGSTPVPRHPYDVEAHNYFGWFLGVSREHRARGRWHLEQAQRRLGGAPWWYLPGGPKVSFARLHARLGAA